MKWKIVTAGVVVVAGLGWGLCVATADGSRLLGTVECNNCGLGRPAPDVGTKAFLLHYESQLRLSIGPLTDYVPRTGDVLVVCNAQGCVDYRRTVSGYVGENFRPQETTPSTGGGGTGSGNGNPGAGRGDGGGPVAGGGGGSGSGSVTVGKPDQVRPPTNED